MEPEQTATEPEWAPPIRNKKNWAAVKGVHTAAHCIMLMKVHDLHKEKTVGNALYSVPLR